LDNWTRPDIGRISPRVWGQYRRPRHSIRRRRHRTQNYIGKSRQTAVQRQTDAIIMLWSEGMSQRRIAMKLGLSPQAVCRVLRKANSVANDQNQQSSIRLQRSSATCWERSMRSDITRRPKASAGIASRPSRSVSRTRATRLGKENWAGLVVVHHQCATVRKPVRQPPLTLPQAAQLCQCRHHFRRGANHPVAGASVLKAAFAIFLSCTIRKP